jgi:hypothetical protein
MHLDANNHEVKNEEAVGVELEHTTGQKAQHDVSGPDWLLLNDCYCFRTWTIRCN